MSGVAGMRSELDRAPVLAAVRRTVRSLLEQSPGFAQAAPDVRKDVASKLVGVAMLGADLVSEDARLSAADDAAEAPPPAASAMAAQPDFGTATKAAGKTFQDIREAIDFPTYVSSLISGVFQAITQSNINQLTQLGDLLDSVSASQEEFCSNIKDKDVITWVVQKFPFVKSSDGEELVLADDVLIDDKKSVLKQALDASDSEVAKIDSDDLLGTLGPLARRRIGRDRQAILATMVKMGLQRVVVDDGRLHASMDMRVDTRSAAERAQASRTEGWMETGASAQVGMGAWGASAHVNAGFSHVNSDQQIGKEEIATRAGLRSSVDLAFRTEQIPLDRMADKGKQVKIDANSRVPASVADGNASLLKPEGYLTATNPKDLTTPIDGAGKIDLKQDSTAAAKAKADADAKAEKEKKEKEAREKAEQDKKTKDAAGAGDASKKKPNEGSK